MKWILAILVVSLIILTGCADITQGNTTIVKPSTSINDSITPEECNNAGGNWNNCGSPCAGTDSDFCITVCKAQCECGGIAGFSCPAEYDCKLSGKIADEIGVCVK